MVLKPDTVRKRIARQGLSLAEALSLPVAAPGEHRRKSAVDHLGQAYPSFTEMCVAWGILENTVRSRLRAGKTLAEALTAPVDTRFHAGRARARRARDADLADIDRLLRVPWV